MVDIERYILLRYVHLIYRMHFILFVLFGATLFE